jgi:hypothetical protein
MLISIRSTSDWCRTPGFAGIAPTVGEAGEVGRHGGHSMANKSGTAAVHTAWRGDCRDDLVCLAGEDTGKLLLTQQI